MRKLIALFVVAILATSVSFAQTGAGASGTGTVNVTVVYANMYINPDSPIDINIQMMPNSTSLEQTFSWQFGGSPGINWLITETGWTLPAGFTIVEEDKGALSGAFPASSTNNQLTTLSGFTYKFKVYCASGTTTGGNPYVLQYGFNVDYN